jgi:hypothetical protein
MKMLLVILLLVAVTAGLGVWKFVGSIKRAGARADAAVAHFHEQWQAGQAGKVMAEASPGFRQAAAAEDFAQFFRVTKEALGDFKHTERTGVNLSSINGNTTLAVTYASEYAKGPATEKFLFDDNGDEPLLLHFDLRSPLLKSVVVPASK